MTISPIPDTPLSGWKNLLVRLVIPLTVFGVITYILFTQVSDCLNSVECMTNTTDWSGIN